jgi:hypothetical protein
MSAVGSAPRRRESQWKKIPHGELSIDPVADEQLVRVAAGVPKDSIRRFLNHPGGDITDHYIRDSALGELQLAEQETISARRSGPRAG